MPLNTEVLITAGVRGKEQVEAFARSIEQVKHASEGMTEAISAAALPLQGILTGLSLGAAVEGIRRAIEFADSIEEMSAKTGLSTKALQEWRYAAGQFSVSNELMDQALSKFVVNLGAARLGSSRMVEAFAALKLDPDRFKSTDEALQAVVERLGGIQDASVRARLEAELFGKEAGPHLAQMVEAGAGSIAKLRQEAEETGAVMDEDTIQKAAASTKQLNAMSNVIKTQLTVAMVELSPAITGVGTALTSAAHAVNMFVQGWQVLLGAKNDVFDPLASQIEAAEGKVRGLRLQLEIHKDQENEGLLGRLFGIDKDKTRQELAEAEANLAELKRRALDMFADKARNEPQEKPRAPWAVPDYDTGKDKEKIDAHTQALQAYLDELNGTYDEEAKFAEQRSMLNELLQMGLITQEQYNDALQTQAGALDVNVEKQKKQNDMLTVFAAEAGRNIQNLTANMINAAQSGQNMGRVVVDALKKIAAELEAQAILNAIFGSFKNDTGFLGTLAKSVLGQKGHTGGIAGAGEFSGETAAPRYHSGGIAGDEIPAILLRGEGIFTPAQMRALAPANDMRQVSVAPVYNIDARGADPASAANIIRALEYTRQRTLAEVRELAARDRLTGSAS